LRTIIRSTMRDNKGVTEIATWFMNILNIVASLIGRMERKPHCK